MSAPNSSTLSPVSEQTGSPGVPYLSIVAASRNDDHGGNLLRRMQIFVDGLFEQCRRHHLDAELILVEWNPPPGRTRLAQALRWPADPAPCTARIVEVPQENIARGASKGIWAMQFVPPWEWRRSKR